MHGCVYDYFSALLGMQVPTWRGVRGSFLPWKCNIVNEANLVFEINI